MSELDEFARLLVRKPESAAGLADVDVLDGLPAGRPHRAARLYEAWWLLRFVELSSPELRAGADAELAAQLADPRCPARSNLALHASLAHRAGDLRRAAHFYARAGNVRTSRGEITNFFSHATSVVYQSPAEAPQACGEPAVPDGRTAIVLSGDSRYVASFLLHYCTSLADAARDLELVLHLAWVRDPRNPDDAAAVAAIESARELVDLKVEEFAPPASPDVRSYCASLRFLVLPKALEQHPLALVTDLDFELCGDLGRLLEHARGHDVTLHRNGPETLAAFFPWLTVMVGVVAVSATPAGHWFAEQFGKLFEETYPGSDANWGIDQNILANLVRHLPEHALVGSATHAGWVFRVPGELKSGLHALRSPVLAHPQPGSITPPGEIRFHGHSTRDAVVTLQVGDEERQSPVYSSGMWFMAPITLAPGSHEVTMWATKDGERTPDATVSVVVG